MKSNNPFYKSSAWLKCRAFVLMRDNHLCQICLKDELLVRGNTVHHILELETHPELALDPENLETLCASCHNKMHPEKGSGKKLVKRKAVIFKSRPNRERW